MASEQAIRKVLDCIENQMLTRAEVARQTGMSSQMVLNIVDSLLRSREIKEAQCLQCHNKPWLLYKGGVPKHEHTLYPRGDTLPIKPRRK